MRTADDPVIRKLTAALRSETAQRAKIGIRTHVLTVDAALERSGTDTGPNPPETLLAALAGCLNIQINRLAGERGIRFERMALSIDAHFDRRGVIWNEDVAVPFPLISSAVEAKSDASASRIAKIRRDAFRCCPVSRVLIEGGTRFRQTTWPVDRLQPVGGRGEA